MAECRRARPALLWPTAHRSRRTRQPPAPAQLPGSRRDTPERSGCRAQSRKRCQCLRKCCSSAPANQWPTAPSRSFPARADSRWKARHATDAGHVSCSARCQFLLRQRQELCARPEHVDPGLVCQPPQQVGLRRRHRRAVIDHERRARGKRARLPVPHHPAARGEIEEPFAVTQIDVQSMFARCCMACRRWNAPCTSAGPWSPRSRGCRADDQRTAGEQSAATSLLSMSTGPSSSHRPYVGRQVVGTAKMNHHGVAN